MFVAWEIQTVSIFNRLDQMRKCSDGWEPFTVYGDKVWFKRQRPSGQAESVVE